MQHQHTALPFSSYFLLSRDKSTPFCLSRGNLARFFRSLLFIFLFFHFHFYLFFPDVLGSFFFPFFSGGFQSRNDGKATEEVPPLVRVLSVRKYLTPAAFQILHVSFLSLSLSLSLSLGETIYYLPKKWPFS